MLSLRPGSRPTQKKREDYMEPWTRQASRSVVAMITTSAALATIMVHSRTLGLVREGRALAAGQAARRVTVAPTADTAHAIGDTIHLAATVTDRHGGVLVGSAVTWRSDNPDVASIDGAGLVVARRAGTTFVSASAGVALAARVRIAVLPLIVELRMVVDTPFVLPEGEVRNVIARALDARGRPFGTAVPSWQSADSVIARVDSVGRVEGLTPGRTTLTASFDGHWAHLDVHVVPRPSAIALLGGADQHASVGRSLPHPVEVQVFSQSGRPAAGVPVRFAPVVEGLGSVEQEAEWTDGDGRARARWVLGPTPGRQRLAVAVGGLDTGLTVTAEADPVAANTDVTLADDVLAGVVGDTILEPVAIRVSDSLGMAVHDVPVAWSAQDGGSVVVLDARTDSLGEARARWTLGPKTGEQRLRVQVGDARSVPAFVVRVPASAGPSAVAVIASGNGQRGAVNAALGKAVVVRVLDALGNPVQGAAVRLAGEGNVGDSALVTDSLGRVLVRWTLGRESGEQRLAVRVAGIDSTLEIVARAHPLEAANVSFVTAPSAGITGRALAKPLEVQVADAYGNPVSDARVSFSTKAGAVSPVHVMTDARGIASARWTLGATPGEQTITARVRATGARATHRLEASQPAKGRKRSPS
jgi:hypothetical protein